MRAAALALILALVPQIGMAQDENYRNCVDWVAVDPVRALSDAEGWRDAGGGLPARHCRALALAAQDDFTSAAMEAEAVAAEMPFSETRANLLMQAGEFRMALGDPIAAKALFDRALADSADHLEALDGRARARAASGDMPGAIIDLDRVLQLRPGDAEALSLRAAAHRQTGNRGAALADAESAVASDPNSAVAYFERGAIRAVSGDIEGARFDWQTAESLDPSGPTGDLARTNLARLP